LDGQGGWSLHPLMHHDGTSWVAYPLMRHDGSSWVLAD
jgi:hypothetical protein